MYLCTKLSQKVAILGIIKSKVQKVKLDQVYKTIRPQFWSSSSSKLELPDYSRVIMSGLFVVLDVKQLKLETVE